ncbi:hypothetical protein ACFRDV_14700 [Streptomyces fagopyri]|uniref:hypothetical protein n=1 Tax=Streptomyces fagopyri TaxID=2662397 RepID=UPI0036C40C81
MAEADLHEDRHADWDVARRFACVRRVISLALDAQLGQDDGTEADALCDQGRFYRTDSTVIPFIGALVEPVQSARLERWHGQGSLI